MGLTKSIEELVKEYRDPQKVAEEERELAERRQNSPLSRTMRQFISQSGRMIAAGDVSDSVDRASDRDHADDADAADRTGGPRSAASISVDDWPGFKPDVDRVEVERDVARRHGGDLLDRADEMLEECSARLDAMSPAPDPGREDADDIEMGA